MPIISFPYKQKTFVIKFWLMGYTLIAVLKVMVNGQEFKPSVAASTKKMAKANAAAAYLQSLGLYPKDPHYPLW